MNQQQLDALRDEILDLLNKRRAVMETLPEQHVLESMDYIRKSIEYLQAAAELGDVNGCYAMCVVLSACFANEARIVKAKQDFLHVRAMAKDVQGDEPTAG